MDGHRGWILALYRRMNARGALHTGFLFDLTSTEIPEEVASQPNGRDQLRHVALSELQSDDPQKAALSLVFLGVVGQAGDSAAAEALSDHPSDLVSRAARACWFALRTKKQAEEERAST